MPIDLPRDSFLSSAKWNSTSEKERLKVLRNYQILDTPPEQVFDDLVKLTAYLCATPIAFISFLSTDRQWFKAMVGVDSLQEMPREMSFCNHMMGSLDILEVEDATQDTRFHRHPMVIGESKVRFYVGVPLLTPEGQLLGSLCAADWKPRQLVDEQREALRVLAREVVAHLELRRARLQLEEEKQKLDGLLRMANSTAESLYALGENRTEIFVKQEQRLIRVPTTDIAYVEALGDYVNIYTERERFTVYSTMKELESKLPAREFTRIHRKYIVCLGRILAIEADAALVEISKGTNLSIPIGNSYKPILLSRLNLL